MLYLTEVYDKSGQKFDSEAVKPNLGLRQTTLIHFFIYYIYVCLRAVGVGSDLLHLTLVNTLLLLFEGIV